MTSTLQVIAQDVKIQVDFNPDVVAYYRLTGYENRDVYQHLLQCNGLDLRNAAVDVGEVAPGILSPLCTPSRSASPLSASLKPLRRL